MKDQQERNDQSLRDDQPKRPKTRLGSVAPMSADEYLQQYKIQPPARQINPRRSRYPIV
jgi:hypothetical protein